MEAIMTVADKFGFPSAVLVAFIVGAWLIIKWLGKNVVLPITHKHIEMVDENKVTAKINADTLQKMAQSAEVTGGAIVRIADQHEEGLRLTREIHQKVVVGIEHKGDQK